MTNELSATEILAQRKLARSAWWKKYWNLVAIVVICIVVGITGLIVTRVQAAHKHKADCESYNEVADIVANEYDLAPIYKDC